MYLETISAASSNLMRTTMTNKPDTALTAAQERAAIVAWLNTEIHKMKVAKFFPDALLLIKTRDKIERGDHHKEQSK